jgi:hypothetical protein
MSLKFLSEPSNTDVDLNSVLQQYLTISILYADFYSLSLPYLKVPHSEDLPGVVRLASLSAFSREDVLLAKQYSTPRVA